MEFNLADHKRELSGTALMLTGLALTLVGGKGIGKKADFFSKYLEERVDATQREVKPAISQQELEKELNHLTHDTYMLGGGLGILITGAVITCARTGPKKPYRPTDISYESQSTYRKPQKAHHRVRI